MFEVEVVCRRSKQGREYICLEVKFPNGYKKIVFLDKAEEYIAEPYIALK